MGLNDDYQFLMGLNDDYQGVTSQVLLIDPLSQINRVFSMRL